MQHPTLLTILLSFLLLLLTQAQAQSQSTPIIQKQTYTGTRITIHSTKNFTSVTSALASEIGTTPKFPGIAAKIASYNATEQALFVSGIDAAVGPHGFMYFAQFNHGFWVPLFNLSVGLGLQRYILGNPLVAVTMLQYDLAAGLFLPPEILIRQVPSGGTDIVYDLPSALIAGVYHCGGDEDEDAGGVEKKKRKQTCDQNALNLLNAAKALDTELQALVLFIAT